MASVQQPLDSLLGITGARAVLLKPPTGATVDTRAIAIDPGRTSGLVIAWPLWPVEAERSDDDNWLIVETSDTVDIWKLLNTYRPHQIIIERFDPQELPVDLMAVEVIGVINLWRSLNKSYLQWRPVVWRQPRDVKNLCSDEFLRQNALWVRGMKHGRDAIRHLCWHLIERKGNTSLLEWTRAKIQE